MDHQLAGGEPLVIADNVHHTLIYTAHEGTTHLYRNGIVNSADFVANYRNQVNIWVSKNDGRTWKRDNFDGTGFATIPTQNSGFSDPDLTQDEGGRIYNTGIDLANDALFSTNDGGYNWDRGTIQCHDGDRPWLAGGKKDEVFLATNTLEGTLSHQIFQSTDGGNTCESSGVPDAGDFPDGADFTGYGKLYYDHHNGKLIEPVLFTQPRRGTPQESVRPPGRARPGRFQQAGDGGEDEDLRALAGDRHRLGRQRLPDLGHRPAQANTSGGAAAPRHRCRTPSGDGLSRVTSARPGRSRSTSPSPRASACSGRGWPRATPARCRSSGTRRTSWWTSIALPPRRRSTRPRS